MASTKSTRVESTRSKPKAVSPSVAKDDIANGEGTIVVPEGLSFYTINVPMARPSERSYQSQFNVHQQLHISTLTVHEIWGWHNLFGGYRKRDQLLENGKPVATMHEAIRALLSDLGKAVEMPGDIDECRIAQSMRLPNMYKNG